MSESLSARLSASFCFSVGSLSESLRMSVCLFVACQVFLRFRQYYVLYRNYSQHIVTLCSCSSMSHTCTVMCFQSLRRLWEAAPYYAATAGVSIPDITRLFSSVYVSWYKGMGSISGATLCGVREFLCFDSCYSYSFVPFSRPFASLQVDTNISLLIYVFHECAL